MSSASTSGKLSTSWLYEVRDSLMNKNVRNSTKINYQGIWRNFNEFIIKLDYAPELWEERVSLYCAFLIEYTDIQSSTIKSYISAIKAKLYGIGYNWNDKLIWLAALTRACKLKNDCITTRLPISADLLELLLFEIERKYNSDEKAYERSIYLTAFLVAYYGLMRIGEYTKSPHALRAVNVHEAQNKRQYTIFLYSSKTHSLGSHPQKIIIKPELLGRHGKRFFCPVEELSNYLQLRPGYASTEEQFFIFQDRTPLLAEHINSLLAEILTKLKLDPQLYKSHSFRIGRATDLSKQGVGIEKIKSLGRWKSNAVYKYLRD